MILPLVKMTKWPKYIVDLDEIWNFGSHQLSIWRHLVYKHIACTCHLFKLKNWLVETDSHENIFQNNSINKFHKWQSQSWCCIVIQIYLQVDTFVETQEELYKNWKSSLQNKNWKSKYMSRLNSLNLNFQKCFSYNFL